MKKSNRSFSLRAFCVCLLALIFCAQLLAQEVPGISLKNGLQIDSLDPDSTSVNQPVPVKSTTVLAKNSAQTMPGDVDQTFEALITQDSAVVEVILPLPDGKILVGGSFINFNEAEKRSLVRLNSNGSLDTSFNAVLDFNIGVWTLARQADGKILVGGGFTVVNGATFNRIVRLNPDGSVDNSFNIGSGFNGFVYDIKLLPDGKAIVAGNFTDYDGTAVGRVVKLNTDGSRDTSFNTSANGFVYRAGIQTDGKILLAGIFTSVNGNPRNCLARINADGSFDSSFEAFLNANVIYDVVPLPDGKMLVGGRFTVMNPSAHFNFARLNSDGSIDETFNNSGVILLESLNAYVEKIELQPDGKIVVGGLFDLYGIARFNSDGTTDNTFSVSPGINASLEAMAIQSDGKILIGGPFTNVQSNERNRLARLNFNGSIDTSFAIGTGFTFVTVGTVYTSVVQPDGKILIGGQFDKVNNVPHYGIARLNADGRLDQTFDPGRGTLFFPGQPNYIYTMALQPDGKILIGGSFNFYDGQPRDNLARLNADGSLDLPFNASANSLVRKILVQPNGKILVGGQFSTINQPFPGALMPSLVRLDNDGTLDSTFENGQTPSSVYDIALQPDEKIIIGGSFSNLNGSARIRRLNPNGSVDSSFDAGSGANGPVFNVELQPDNKVLISGSFTNVNGAARTRIARLNADGSIDSAFDPGAGANATVYETFYQLNGKILIGGAFTQFDNTPKPYFTRLNNDGTLDNSFALTTNGLIWNLAAYQNDKIIVSGGFSLIGNTGRTSTARIFVESVPGNRPMFDFDGDGKTDLSIFRPSGGEWWYLRSSDGGNRAFGFGSSTDRIAPADYTGDGKTDVAVWRPSTGEWFILRSEDSSFYSFPFGASGDIPAPADFDGDGRADPAVFRPGNSTWYIIRSGDGGVTISQFGANGDLPAAADYDGDNKADLAIFRPSDGSWWLNRTQAGLIVTNFGSASDKTVPADYTGDGRADVAFFRPSTGEWFILRSEDFSFYSFPFGTSGDTPTPGDYDGDGRADQAVFRNSTATWYLLRSTSGFTALSFGASGDTPVPSAYNR